MLLLLSVACTPTPVEDSKPSGHFDTAIETDVDTDVDSDTDTDTDTDIDTGWTYSEDSDGDGMLDLDEGRLDEVDTDRDGTPDYADTDSDDDGILDATEAQPIDGFAAEDTDGDGTPDFQDTDSDEDGLRDRLEGEGDIDADGTANYRDVDADGDSIPDAIELDEDWDGDGVANWEDTLNNGTIGSILFEAISTEFNSPIGIDFHEYSETVVLSVNYSTGDPIALERVAPDGTHVTFSALEGVTDEVKIATARSGNTAGFSMGELFVGNGVDGQIVRISPDGTTIDNPWVDLPGSSNGLMRGSLYVDRTGVFGDELIVATTVGQVWQIDSVGNATLLADLGVHLEGLITVPNAPLRYGPLAGKVLVGAEQQGLMHAIGTDGSVTSYDIGVTVEDLDIINPYENFFGVNYGTSRLIGGTASEFLPMAGDILVTNETVTSVGLFRLYWDGSALHADELTASAGSATIAQWEHTTFAAAGIQEVPQE